MCVIFARDQYISHQDADVQIFAYSLSVHLYTCRTYIGDHYQTAVNIVQNNAQNSV